MGLKMLFFQRFASENQGKRRVVVDDHAAVAVENSAARGEDRDRFDAVGLRTLVVELRILNLELPEAGNQKKKDKDGGVLKDRNFGRREMRIVAQRRFFGNLLLEIRVDRRQGHNKAECRSIPILAAVSGRLPLPSRDNRRDWDAAYPPVRRWCCPARTRPEVHRSGDPPSPCRNRQLHRTVRPRE